MHAIMNGIRWAALAGLLMTVPGCLPPTNESETKEKTDEKAEKPDAKRRVIQRFTPGLETRRSRPSARNNSEDNKPPAGPVENPAVQNPPVQEPVSPPATPRGRQTAPPTTGQFPRRITSSSYPSNPVATNVQIRLSAGASKAQYLPGGTQMSFQAYYQFVSGGPSPRHVYAWVIQGRGKTKRFWLRTPLKSDGRLPPLFTKELRPEDQPFRSYMEVWDRSTGKSQPRNGRRISNTIPLN